MDDIAVGAELIYRVRENASSEHVRIAEIDNIKRPPHYVVESVHGEKEGTREHDPGSRLRRGRQMLTGKMR